MSETRLHFAEGQIARLQVRADAADRRLDEHERRLDRHDLRMMLLAAGGAAAGAVVGSAGHAAAQGLLSALGVG